ncbi:hypothetical protein N9Y92_02910, partial [Chlamydiales bacterium]|nr:hypothetical protein [Chlamydiales bacterium]
MVNRIDFQTVVQHLEHLVENPQESLELEATNPFEIIENKESVHPESLIYTFLSLNRFEEAKDLIDKMKQIGVSDIITGYYHLFKAIEYKRRGEDESVIIDDFNQAKYFSEKKCVYLNPLQKARLFQLKAMIGFNEGDHAQVEENFKNAINLFHENEAQGLAAIAAIYFAEYSIHNNDYDKAKKLLLPMELHEIIDLYPFVHYNHPRLSAKILEHELKTDKSVYSDWIGYSNLALHRGLIYIKEGYSFVTELPTALLELEVKNPFKMIKFKNFVLPENLFYAYLSLDQFREAFQLVNQAEKNAYSKVSMGYYYLCRAMDCRGNGQIFDNYLEMVETHIEDLEEVLDPILKGRLFTLKGLQGSVKGSFLKVEENFRNAIDLFHQNNAQGLSMVTEIYLAEYLINQKEWVKAKTLLGSMEKTQVIKYYPFVHWNHPRLLAKVLKHESQYSDWLNSLTSAYDRGIHYHANRWPIPFESLEGMYSE